jgi:thiol-disulfide isomerase/thioredoxin
MTAPAVLLLFLASTALAEAPNEATYPVKRGERAPNFNIGVVSPATQSGKDVRLYDLVGADRRETPRLVLVTFFATWCPSCKEEQAVLQRLQDRHAKDKLRVLVVVVEDQEAKVIKFASENQLTLPYLMDDYSPLVVSKYLGDSRSLPATFLVGPDGTVLEAFSGLKTDLESRVAARL